MHIYIIIYIYIYNYIYIIYGIPYLYLSEYIYTYHLWATPFLLRNNPPKSPPQTLGKRKRLRQRCARSAPCTPDLLRKEGSHPERHCRLKDYNVRGDGFVHQQRYKGIKIYIYVIKL